MERPVVSTTLGAEGLDLKHGRDIAIADSPEEFTRQTVRLLRDPGLRRRLAECGRGIVLEKYSLTNVEAAVEEALAKVFRGGGKDNLRGPALQRGSAAFSHAQAAGPALTGSVRPKLDSRAVGDAVRRVTTEVIHTIFPSDVAAIVLTGSLARGEASVLCSNGVAKVLGDVEFVIVFREHVPLPRLERFRPVREQIESRLRTRGIQCHLDFSSVRKNFFERQRHHIFGYELGANGKTIWGDPSILDSLQPVSARDIPQEDAWRMLCNRIIEQLRALIPVFRTEPYRCEEILYELVKFKLDQATSLLVFLDEYEPTYRRRAEKIASLAQSGEYPALPFSLKALADRTRDATDIKLHPRIDALLIRPSNSTNLRAELLRRLAEPVPLVRALWEWELGRMLEREKTSDSRNGGWETWLGRQNALGRYRSWSHLLWHSRANLSPREWGRTLRLMGHGSPRYLTYVAGSFLYFSLPAVLEGEEKTVRAVVEKSRKLLPAFRQSGRQPVSWLDACQEVVWNYESFLVRTRS